MITARFSAILKKSVHFLVAAIACVGLIFSSAYPAFAAGQGTPTSPTQGETQLPKIIDRSEDAAKTGIDSMKEVAKRSEQGLNEVQGAADYDKMQRPENSQEATSFIDQVKETLEKANPMN